MLERRATPAVVEAAVTTLREAGVANLSLDVIHGIPGQDRALLDADLDRLVALEPDHCSVYELEAKPGTRFTHAHGAELARQGELMEEHYERVIERLEGAGYTWYESANFARPGRESQHNRAYWLGRDYLGIGVGAVSTVGHGAPRQRAPPGRLPDGDRSRRGRRRRSSRRCPRRPGSASG